MVAGVGAAFVALIVAVVASQGGGKGHHSCLLDLAQHLSAQDRANLQVVGTDLSQARAEGYDDGGTLDKLGPSRLATGTYPGDVARRLRFDQLYDVATFKARTGFAPDAITCSLGTNDREVSAGSFTAADVQASALGDQGTLAATTNRLAFGDQPTPLLQPLAHGSLADDERFTDVLGALVDQKAYSVVVERAAHAGGKGPDAAGAGIAKGPGDGREAVLVWRYPNPKDAPAGRGPMARQLRSVYSHILSVSAPQITAHGRLLVGRFPISDPSRWSDPILNSTDRLLPR